jgi:hypothetical protein
MIPAVARSQQGTNVTRTYTFVTPGIVQTHGFTRAHHVGRRTCHPMQTISSFKEDKVQTKGTNGASRDSFAGQ